MTFRDDNGNELNFDGDFAMTKQSVSIFSGKIKGDVSITFSVDNNSENRATLGYYGPQMLNQVAWTKQAFNRVRNGNVIDRGYIVIQSDEGDTLECYYVSGNSNWVQRLNGLITELTWPFTRGNFAYALEFYRVWTFTASSSTTSGIVFPFADYAFDLKKGYNLYMGGYSLVDKNGDRQLRSFCEIYPALFMHSLVEQIGEQNDIKFTGDVFDDAIFKSLVIPPSNGQLKGDPFFNISARGADQADIPNNGSAPVKYNSFTETNDPITYLPDRLFTLINTLLFRLN